MKKWKRYEKCLLTGDWHVHTTYTDGKNTIFEYCEDAEARELELIAFTEHVRRELTYNFDDFIADVYSAKDKFDIIILGGCEAKVLDLSGRIDVQKEVLENCEIVLAAFHRWNYQNKEDYIIAVKNMLAKSYVDIWAHPTIIHRKFGFDLSEEEMKQIVKICHEKEVLIEKNARYNLPDENFIMIAEEEKCKFVYGSDAHSINEIGKRWCE